MLVLALDFTVGGINCELGEDFARVLHAIDGLDSLLPLMRSEIAKFPNPVFPLEDIPDEDDQIEDYDPDCYDRYENVRGYAGFSSGIASLGNPYFSMGGFGKGNGMGFFTGNSGGMGNSWPWGPSTLGGAGYPTWGR